MSSSSTSSSIYFGKPHPKLQQYTCSYEDLINLMDAMPSQENPIGNWKKPNDEKVVDHGDVLSWFRKDNHVAFYGPPTASRLPLSYTKLHEQISNFSSYDIPSSSEKGIFVVALLLPASYMAEMAAVLMTLLAQEKDGICVAPMDPNMPMVKLEAALEQLQCTALVTTQDLYDTLPKEKLDLLKDIRLVEPSAVMHHVGAVDWTILKKGDLLEAHFDMAPGSDPPGLLLRTSGTTATPKIVPLTRKALLYNATCLAASLQLKPEEGDVGCNAMPLFHIGGISCGLLAVLVSGSSVVMMPGPFDSQAFFDAITTPSDTSSSSSSSSSTTTTTTTPVSSGKYQQPTWYYGVPSMHKALLLTAKAHHNNITAKNCLRFIRSGAAHLPHGTAVELAQVFQTHVYPTYSMSECMPICSCHDAPVVAQQPSVAGGKLEDTTETTLEIFREGIPDDTVGVPVGCSLAIVDVEGNILPYGQIGQVALKGAGVIQGYIGIPKTDSHTREGWFLTGDMGKLDKNGRLVLSGRQKEMIKRGGDQVWPNEVDGVVESVPGVRLAVTFGVPNELWGEEVHVAVILDESELPTDKVALEKAIVEACTENLGAASAPSKVHYVDSPDSLLKGSTGKFLRTKMADHLGATAVDTGALHALEAMGNLTADAAVEEPRFKANPSTALNGVRFLTACFVVQHHVGLMPNAAWLKIQTFTFNMTIFFLLGAFQLTTSIKSEVKSNSAQFIGTKIGSMHSLFLVSQVIALGSYILFQCGANGYAEAFDGKSCTESFAGLFIGWILSTLTGMGGLANVVNAPAWFQTAFYILLILFPLLDANLRPRGRVYKTVVFWINLLIASIGIVVLFAFGGYFLNFLFISWMPAWVSAMIAAYWFSEHASLEDRNPENNERRGLLQRPQFWGILTDILSIIFLLFEVLVALSPGCVSILIENYRIMRPGEALPDDLFEQDGRWYGTVCDLTYDEFVEYVHDEPDDLNLGRWSTNFGSLMGFFRLGTPLVLLWLFGLSYGRGLSARLMSTQVMQYLAPFAYPLYLLHLPISRFYWVATRGHEAKFWWPDAAGYPVPVEWYELFIIIGICLALAVPLDRYVVQYLSPYTIGWGVWVCKFLARFCCCCCGNASIGEGDEAGSTTLSQVEAMVKGLTGNTKVDRSTKLGDLGLDSLGATALLGTLRSAVPNAKSLTMAQLSSCETVGDLVDMLDERHVAQDDTKQIPPV